MKMANEERSANEQKLKDLKVKWEKVNLELEEIEQSVQQLKNDLYESELIKKISAVGKFLHSGCDIARALNIPELEIVYNSGYDNRPIVTFEGKIVLKVNHDGIQEYHPSKDWIQLIEDLYLKAEIRR